MSAAEETWECAQCGRARDWHRDHAFTPRNPSLPATPVQDRDDEAGHNPELMALWNEYCGSLTYHSLFRAYEAGRAAVLAEMQARVIAAARGNAK